MHHVVLIGLIVFALAVGVGLVAATVRGLQAWRDFRAFRRTVLGLLAEVSAALAKVEGRSTKAAGSAARLEQARRRLQRTLELAAVVLGAARESRALFRQVRGVVPRK